MSSPISPIPMLAVIIFVMIAMFMVGVMTGGNLVLSRFESYQKVASTEISRCRAAVKPTDQQAWLHRCNEADVRLRALGPR